jgi:hypothetical protein
MVSAEFGFCPFAIFSMSGSVLLHRQLSPRDLQQLLAWYKIRDTLLGLNYVQQDIKKALDLACVCDHPNAFWLTKLFAGRDVASREEARQVFLGCEYDPRALCFAGVVVRDFDEIRRAADLGDAFAQAWMAGRRPGGERFWWAEKSAAQGERDGFYQFGRCYRYGSGCVEDAEKGKKIFLVAAELGHMIAMVGLGKLLEKDDSQRFYWFGRAATANGDSLGAVYFLNEMRGQIRKFNSGTGHASVIFGIGRALKGHINNEKRTIFGNLSMFDARIGPANQALHFYEFQLQSYRKAVNSWTIVGLRNKVVKDIRKMIGKVIWDAREEVSYLEEK